MRPDEKGWGFASRDRGRNHLHFVKKLHDLPTANGRSECRIYAVFHFLRQGESVPLSGCPRCEEAAGPAPTQGTPAPPPVKRTAAEPMFDVPVSPKRYVGD